MDSDTDPSGADHGSVADESTPDVAAEQSRHEVRQTADLTSDPRVRQMQSSYDRRLSDQARQMREMQQRFEELQASQTQRTQQEVDSLDPAEQAKYYRTQTQQLRQQFDQQRQQSEADKKSAALFERASRMITSAGLTWDNPEVKAVMARHPRPSEDGIVELAEVLLTAKRTPLPPQKPSADPIQAAKNQALRDAKVPMTSNGATAVQQRDRKAEEIRALRKEWASVRKAGVESKAVREFDRKLRAKGLTVSDLS